ncbi:MAG: hypothetical protein ACK53L_21255, partial [Pirellulaceae bacterium]
MASVQSSASTRSHEPNTCNQAESTLRLYSSVETQRIGIVAGWGEYPMRVAQALSRRGDEVVIAAIQG